MKRALVGILASFSLLVAAAPAQAQTAPSGNCQFQAGFADMATLVPAVVGSCVSNAHPANQFGDTMQETSNGLLTWTKATDITEFTTGQKTWVLSGYGLILREATTAYSWEGPTSVVAGVSINSKGEAVDPISGTVLPKDAHLAF